MAIATINPATGETVRTCPPLTDAQVEACLTAAASSYPATTFTQRAVWLRATADLLDAEAPRTAAVMTLEMGKTLTAAQAEVHKCAAACRYYADHAEAMLADEPVAPAEVSARQARRNGSSCTPTCSTGSPSGSWPR
jgi:succinate-semialdehyde dehydrogenase / glutarate-semialdehyde dehydrogenase